MKSWKERSSLVSIPSPTTGVSVWAMKNDSAETAAEFGGVISVEEHEKAARFHRELDRIAYVVTRGALRALLSEQLRRCPGELRIRTGLHGKPSLASNLEESLDFNVTHTRGYSYIALSRSGPVGIDVEWLDREVEVEALTESFFHPEECIWLRGLPVEARSTAFFRLWVRKEALMKGIGIGLGPEFARYPLIDSPGLDLVVRTEAPTSDGRRRWRVSDLKSESGYHAAIATLA